MTHITSIELIKTCFQSEYYPEYFKGHNTHDANLKFINQIIAHTKDCELIARLINSGLPAGYQGDALAEVDTIMASAISLGYDKPSTNSSKSKKKKEMTSALLK